MKGKSRNSQMKENEEAVTSRPTLKVQLSKVAKKKGNKRTNLGTSGRMKQYNKQKYGLKNTFLLLMNFLN